MRDIREGWDAAGPLVSASAAKERHALWLAKRPVLIMNMPKISKFTWAILSDRLTSSSLSQRWRLIRSYYYFPTTGYPRGGPISRRPPLVWPHPCGRQSMGRGNYVHAQTRISRRRYRASSHQQRYMPKLGCLLRDAHLELSRGIYTSSSVHAPLPLTAEQ